MFGKIKDVLPPQTILRALKRVQNKSPELILQALEYLLTHYPYSFKVGYLKEQFKKNHIEVYDRPLDFQDMFVKLSDKLAFCGNDKQLSIPKLTKEIESAIQKRDKYYQEHHVVKKYSSVILNKRDSILTDKNSYLVPSKDTAMAILHNVAQHGIAKSAGLDAYFCKMRNDVKQNQHSETELEQMNYNIHHNFKVFERTNIIDYVKMDWVRCAVASATSDRNYISYTQQGDDGHIYACYPPQEKDKKQQSNDNPFAIDKTSEAEQEAYGERYPRQAYNHQIYQNEKPRTKAELLEKIRQGDFKPINSQLVINELTFVIKMCAEIANDYYKNIKTLAMSHHHYPHRRH